LVSLVIGGPGSKDGNLMLINFFGLVDYPETNHLKTFVYIIVIIMISVSSSSHHHCIGMASSSYSSLLHSPTISNES